MMAARKSRDGFTGMKNSHFDEVQNMDIRVNGGDYPAKSLRAAIRDDEQRAFVLINEGKVAGFVVISVKKNPTIIYIERIGANDASSYNRLLTGVFFLSEEMFNDCESIHAFAMSTNMLLRGCLVEHGFYAYKSRGKDSMKRLLFCKIMRESTWADGDHYGFGALVIDEILNGESRVLGAENEVQ